MFPPWTLPVRYLVFLTLLRCGWILTGHGDLTSSGLTAGSPPKVADTHGDLTRLFGDPHADLGRLFGDLHGDPHADLGRLFGDILAETGPKGAGMTAIGANTVRAYRGTEVTKRRHTVLTFVVSGSVGVVRKVEARLNQSETGAGLRCRLLLKVRSTLYRLAPSVVIGRGRTTLDLSKYFLHNRLLRQTSHGRLTVKLKVGGCRSPHHTRVPPAPSDVSGYLVIYSQDRALSAFSPRARPVTDRTHRPRRSLPDLCRLEDFTVEFESGVVPRTMNVHQCRGNCPTPLGQDYFMSYNAMLRSLRSPGDASVSLPCCVPVEFSPVNLIYQEYGGLVMSLREDLVATRCRCM